MANAWADGLPTVMVPNGETQKPVTLVYPYYQNPSFLLSQMKAWESYPEELDSLASLVVVDDGSPTAPARDVIRDWLFRFKSVRLFRVGVDVPWNWLTARNIGAHHASDGWLLLTDMDHVVPTETLKALVYGQHDPNVVYAFSRREHTGEAIQPHSASFFLTKDLFWKIGGYDEELSGRYGSDGDFRRRAKAHAPIVVLADTYLERHEYVGDSSTTRYARKSPEDAMAIKRIVESRAHGWKPRTLSFPYQEVACSQS